MNTPPAPVAAPVACPHCGEPTAGLLAGCRKPGCITKDIAIEAAWKRYEDQ